VFEPPASFPKKLLSVPVLLEPPASFPKKLLLAPVLFEPPALLPKKLLLAPVVLKPPALFPKKLLLAPALFEPPALLPKKLLLAPVVFENPALFPKKLLFAPVVFALPPPKAIVVPLGILSELYNVAAPSSCPANNTKAGLRTSTTATLSKFPVNVEVVNLNPPVALGGVSSTALPVTLYAGSASVAFPTATVTVPAL
jgi:hypothetical protein